MHRFVIVIVIALVACADKHHLDTPTITATDPKDPAAWSEAARLAQRAATDKHSDALPFLFDGPKGPVLVHHGKVVTERGPAVAGAYLRDLGVIRSAGPTIDDAVYALAALDALPAVDKLSKDAFVHATDAKLADIHP